jgi:hypothetical protein
MANHEVLKDIAPGTEITAKYLTKTTRAVNEMTRAIRSPREVLQPSEELQTPAGEDLGNEIFACTVTESTITATDSNGDTTPLKRVDTLSCTESTTGRTMSFDITYPA